MWPGNLILQRSLPQHGEAEKVTSVSAMCLLLPKPLDRSRDGKFFIINICILILAVFILIGMIIWGICFGSELRENGGVSDTISQVESYTGNGSLGYSYW